MIAWLVETLIVTTMLLALVLAIREPVRQMFGAKVAYALWLLPALRMVMPPLPALVPQGSPLAGMAQSSGMVSQIIRDRMIQLDTVPVALQSDPQGPIGWAMALAGLWLAGALGFALWQMLSYRRFCRHVLDGARPRRSPARGIRLMASPHVSGPMAFGLTRRFILFPHDALTRFDVEEHAMALAHELAHHRRGDLIANAFALGMLALHWCNPLAWIAHRAFRADQEMACDADVIAGIRDLGLGQAYGRALVKCASGREFSAICHLTTVDRLKRRLTMLSRSNPSARRRMAGLALAGAVVLSGLALTASGEGMAAQVGAKVSDALPIPRGQDMLPSLPALPTAMAADTAGREARHAYHEAQAAQAEAARESAVAVVDVPPALPTPPSPPAVTAVPPAPPASPAPPRVRGVTMVDGHVVRVADWQRDIPTAEEIRAQVPIIDVVEGRDCSGGDGFVGTREETVRVNGQDRQKTTITICRGMERHVRAEAMRGMQQARAEIVRADVLSDRIRSQVLAEFDRQIAAMRRQGD